MFEWAYTSEFCDLKNSSVSAPTACDCLREADWRASRPHGRLELTAVRWGKQMNYKTAFLYFSTLLGR